MRVYRLKDGMEYSPTSEIPRNAKCLCGSGKKWKVCHMDRLKVTSHPDVHARMMRAWRNGEDTTVFFKPKEEKPADA